MRAVTLKEIFPCKFRNELMATASICKDCGAPIPASAPGGLCTRCLFTLGLEAGTLSAEEAVQFNREVPRQCPAPEREVTTEQPTGQMAGTEANTQHQTVPSLPKAPEGPREPAGLDSRSSLPLGRIGDYELIEEIARGGMGIVYRAWQRSLDRVVALKTLLFGPQASPEFVKRFRAEAAAAASLNHPNIVAIHEVGVHKGQHYLVMDLVEGPNLAQTIQEQPLSARHAAQILKAVAEAVHYAHERGILHRDLKPSNILLDAEGQPHVTDFGLAKRFDGDSSLTLTGQVLGSPSYMPPEQAGADRGKVGRRSDVFSLGAMLYHAVTGRPPFAGETMNETLDQVFHREPLSPRLLNAGVPRDLETICLKCLEKEPARRYSTARELAEELGRFLGDEPIQARPVSGPEKIWRWCRRKPALAALILLLHLVGATGLAGILWQAHRTEVQRVEAQKDLYVANVHRANDAMNGHNLDSAREFLRAIEDSPAQRAMRDWSWRHVAHRAWSDEIGTLGRHDAWLADLAVSSDQRRCATISEDGMAKLWDLAAGREITSWRAHAKVFEDQPDWQYHAVVFTRDGSMLITAGEDAAVRFWDLNASSLGAPPSRTHEITGLSNAVNRLAISRNGNLLAGQGEQGSVYVWRLTNGSPNLLVEFKFAAEVPTTVALSPDEKTLLVGWVEKPILRCEHSNADDSREPQPLTNTSPPFDFSPDGQWLVTAGRSRHVVRRWRWPELESLPELTVQGGGAHAFAFSPDSRLLAAGLEGGQLNTWDLTNRATSRPLAVLHGHTELVDAVAFWQSSNGLKLISASADKTVRLWEPEVAKGEEIVLPVRAPALAVAVSPDGSYLATVVRTLVAPGKKTVFAPFELQLWDFKTRLFRKAVPFGGQHSGLWIAFSPDSKLLAVTDYSPLEFYKVPSLEHIKTVGSRGQIFATNGSWLAYIGNKGIIKRESLEAPEQVLVPGRGDLQQLALSPDGRVVAGSEQSGAKIWLWDARDGHSLGPPLSGHTLRIVALAFTPDGRTLVSCGWDGRLGIWDVGGRKNLAFLRGHNNSFNQAVLSPDGSTIATGGDDSLVRLWNVARRQEIAVLQGHADNVNSLAFSQDGQWLASASDDGTIRLWRAPSFEEIARSPSTE